MTDRKVVMHPQFQAEFNVGNVFVECGSCKTPAQDVRSCIRLWCGCRVCDYCMISRWDCPSCGQEAPERVVRVRQPGTEDELWAKQPRRPTQSSVLREVQKHFGDYSTITNVVYPIAMDGTVIRSGLGLTFGTSPVGMYVESVNENFRIRGISIIDFVSNELPSILETVQRFSVSGPWTEAELKKWAQDRWAISDENMANAYKEYSDRSNKRVPSKGKRKSMTKNGTGQ